MYRSFFFLGLISGYLLQSLSSRLLLITFSLEQAGEIHLLFFFLRFCTDIISITSPSLVESHSFLSPVLKVYYFLSGAMRPHFPRSSCLQGERVSPPFPSRLINGQVDPACRTAFPTSGDRRHGLIASVEQNSSSLTPSVNQGRKKRESDNLQERVLRLIWITKSR